MKLLISSVIRWNEDERPVSVYSYSNSVVSTISLNDSVLHTRPLGERHRPALKFKLTAADTSAASGRYTAREVTC